MRHSIVERSFACLLIGLLAGSCATPATSGGSAATSQDTGAAAPDSQEPADKDVTTTAPDAGATADVAVEDSGAAPADAGPKPTDAGPSATAAGADAASAAAPDAVDDADELTLTVEELLEQQLIQYDIQKMKPTKDGSDYGVRNAKADGSATFYSPKLKAVFDVSINNDDDKKPKPIGGVRVSVKAEDNDHIFVLVTDSTGLYEPAMYTGKLVNGSVDVKSSTSGGDEEPFVYDSKAGNPFEVDKDGTLVGTLATMAVKCVLRTIAMGAISFAVKKLVTSVCTMVMPLYTDTCAIIAELSAWVVTAAITGGIKLKFEGAVNWSTPFAKAMGDATLGWFIGWGCEKGTGALMVAYGWVTGTGTLTGHNAVVKRYKKLTWRMNYLLDKMGQPVTPPATPMTAQQKKFIGNIIKRIHEILIYHKPFVHKNFFVTYSGESVKQAAKGTLFEKMIESVGNLADKAYDVKPPLLPIDASLIISASPPLTYSNLWKAATIKSNAQKIVFEKIKWQQTSTSWKLKNLGHAIGCGLGIMKGFNGYVTNNTSDPSLNIDSIKLANEGLEFGIRVANKAYDLTWGGSIVDPTCYPDLQEPNDKFVQKGMVAPFNGKMMFDKMTLKKGDVDWMTLPVKGVISKVQAGVGARNGGAGDCPGPAMAQLCLQLYWYSNINELSDSDPFPIGSEKCGQIGPAAAGNDPQFSTDKLAVSSGTGEQNARLVVRVRHKTAPGADVPYKLMVFAGKAF